MSHYQVSQLKHLGERSLVDDLQVLRSQFNPNATGTALIGIFTGLFGLASDECLLLTKQPALTPELIPQGFKIVQAHYLSATVRPTPTQSFDQAGIYVFRFWTLPGNQVDALIALSVRAWETFEGDFDTEVKALFRQSTPAIQETALLITWYKNFAAWEASRQPDPAATDYFRQRQSLIDQAFPIATRRLS
ncbi:MAG: hypothetical protein P8N63_11395 [Pseudomonadales bacterium]|nr:hypothetical protein [Pseudomonadales bacterium]